VEITISRNKIIFLIEIVDQVWFFINLSILKQYIVVGCEPIILVLNARFRSLQARFQISFVQYDRQIEGRSSKNRLHIVSLIIV
jgi:uncharacterized membrane protein